MTSLLPNEARVLAQRLQLFNGFEVRRLTRKGGMLPGPQAESSLNLTNRHQ